MVCVTTRTKSLQTNRKQDQRVPGYIEGYVRRFWQVSNAYPIKMNFLLITPTGKVRKSHLSYISHNNPLTSTPVKTTAVRPKPPAASQPSSTKHTGKL
jgi:hypothetical protein